MNDLFDVPPTRPMPAELHERVLAELSAAPDPRRDRAPRWIAPVIAATLVAGVGGGAIALHRSQPVANPLAPVSTSSRPDHPLSGAALVAQCQQGSSKLLGLQAWAPAGVPGALFHDGAGHIAVCLSVRGNAGTTATSVTDPVDSTQASGSSVDAVTRVGDSATVHAVVGGILPPGATDAVIESAPGLNGTAKLLRNGRYWMFTGSLSDAARNAEPTTKVIGWSGGGRTHAARVRWYGSADDLAVTGTQLAADCTKSVEEDASSPRIRRTLLSPDQHGVLLVSDKGRLYVCTESSPGGTGWNADSVVPGDPLSERSMAHLGVATSDSPEFQSVLGGRVPSGVTAIEITSLDGTTRASLADGYWAWSKEPSMLAQGVFPTHQVLRMFSGHRLVHSMVIDGADGPASHDANLGELSLGYDAALTRACRPAGQALLTSWGGHAELVQTASGTATCLVDDSGHRYVLANGTTFPANLSVGKVASSKTDVLPITVYAGGGVAPAGTTDITFRTSMGDVPATVEDGHWVFELAVTNRSASDAPLRATAMVTTNGSVTSYPVTLG